jgi:hypothetical protein
MCHDSGVRSAQFSADGQWVVTSSEDNAARVWDAAAGKAIGEPMRHEGLVNSAQFSADGQRVVTASDDRTARGQRVVTASEDKTARVWDVPAITNQDTSNDVLFLADLAGAVCGSILQTSGLAYFAEMTPATIDCAMRQDRVRALNSLATAAGLRPYGRRVDARSECFDERSDRSSAGEGLVRRRSCAERQRHR